MVVQIAFLLAVELTLVYDTLVLYPRVLRLLFVAERSYFLALLLKDLG